MPSIYSRLGCLVCIAGWSAWYVKLAGVLAYGKRAGVLAYGKQDGVLAYVKQVGKPTERLRQALPH